MHTQYHFWLGGGEQARQAGGGAHSSAHGQGQESGAERAGAHARAVRQFWALQACHYILHVTMYETDEELMTSDGHELYTSFIQIRTVGFKASLAITPRNIICHETCLPSSLRCGPSIKPIQRLRHSSPCMSQSICCTERGRPRLVRRKSAGAEQCAWPSAMSCTHSLSSPLDADWQAGGCAARGGRGGGARAAAGGRAARRHRGAQHAHRRLQPGCWRFLQVRTSICAGGCMPLRACLSSTLLPCAILDYGMHGWIAVSTCLGPLPQALADQSNTCVRALHSSR